ncbi:MAG: hypothetical protein IT370_37645 [Deltaproteobacteria bacterium]|nr:hypothetical protein [Deltaproteobacteria bacterium]
MELLPREIPAPPEQREIEVKLPGRRHRLYVRHIVATSTRLLEWYLECRRGLASRPLAGSIPRPGESGAANFVLSLAEEPQLPAMACLPLDAGDLLPFRLKWHDSPRVHHLLAVDPKALRDSLEGAEAAAAWQVVSDELGIDLERNPQLLGSVHLIVPNPTFRRIHLGCSGDGNEILSVRPILRAGASMEGLELVVSACRPMGRTKMVRSVLAEYQEVDMGGDVDRVEVHVFDAKGAVVYHMEPVGFIDSISMVMNVSDTLRRVEVPAKGAREAESYSVSVTSHPSVHVVGTPLTRLALGMVAEWRATRKRERLTERLGQRWFSRDLPAATAHIRELLRGAQRRVLIVDRYFAALELQRFAMAVSVATVPIQIVSSGEVLRKGREAAALADAIRIYQTSRGANPVDVRVMEGLEVHDRFILLDDTVYLLGSSLNSFGDHGTMMIALPSPNMVEAELSATWDRAKPLSEWIALRTKAQERARAKAGRRGLVAVAGSLGRAIRRALGR